MDEPPEVWLVRHGETAWSRDRLHTSITDVPLTDRGVEAGSALRERLGGRAFSLVASSPRRRALHTAALAGFPDVIVDADLALDREAELFEVAFDGQVKRGFQGFLRRPVGPRLNRATLAEFRQSV